MAVSEIRKSTSFSAWLTLIIFIIAERLVIPLSSKAEEEGIISFLLAVSIYLAMKVAKKPNRILISDQF